MAKAHTVKEKNIRLYKAALRYLMEIVPEGIELEKYYHVRGIKNKTLSDIFDRFLCSAQNYQRMPNVIKYNERKNEIRNILCDFDVNKVARMDVEKLYQKFRKTFKVQSADNNFNSWHKWSKSIIDSAKFLSEFKDVEDFNSFVRQFDYNIHTRMALPLLMSERISGMGFALCCDCLKELGFETYPKPDVHMIDVFEAFGLVNNREPLDTFEAIVRMAEDCKEIDTDITPYKVDKIIWLICSGRFYDDDVIVKRHKDEFIRRYC